MSREERRVPIYETRPVVVCDNCKKEAELPDYSRGERVNMEAEGWFHLQQRYVLSEQAEFDACSKTCLAEVMQTIMFQKNEQPNPNGFIGASS